MRSLTIVLLVLSIIVGLSTAAAQSTSSSAISPTYLRVASSLPKSNRISIGSKNFDNTGNNKVTPYQRVDPGQYSVEVDNKKLQVNIPTGSYSTLVLTRDGGSAVGFVVRDGSGSPPDGMVSVKFVHAAPESSPVSVQMRMAESHSASLRLFTVQPQTASPSIALQPSNSATFQLIETSDSALLSDGDSEETSTENDTKVVASVRLSNGLQNTRYTIFFWPDSSTTTAIDGSRADTDPESGTSEMKLAINATLLCSLLVFMLLF